MNPSKMNLAAAGVVVVLGTAFALGFLRPGVRRLEAARADAAQQVERVREKQAALGSVSDLYSSILDLGRQMFDFRKRLPSDRQFGEFLNYLSDSFRRCKIENYVVEPKPALLIDDSSVPEDLTLLAGTTVLPVRIEFQTDFPSMVKFLNRLEKNTRLSHVESISLVNDELKPGSVKADMVLHTYFHP